MTDASHYPPMEVSRETKVLLDRYAEMIRKWNPAINLISKTTTDEIYQRHLLDSLQVLQNPSLPSGLWVDIGSGGGLPGLVVAIDAKVRSSHRWVVLVESDKRKATFLREVIRALDLNAEVITARIEDVPPLSAKVISARALAPLTELCAFAFRHLSKDGMAVFHKGENRATELLVVQESWKFDLKEVQSITNPNAAILYLKEICHA
jgi:16S rRNA (guanine527-N7)-methyltransferase